MEKNMHKYTFWFMIVFALSLMFSGCGQPTCPQNKVNVCFKNGYDDKDYRVAKNAKAEIGNASYYAKCMQGRRTASGETCDLCKYTAAHRTFPFGTMLRVTMLQNNKSVIVKVNDRGPRVRGRVVDLSFAAAKQLGLVRAGVAKVKVERLEKVNTKKK